MPGIAHPPCAHRRFRRKLAYDRNNNKTTRDVDNSKYIVNLSSRPLTNVETRVLSKGLKFVPTPRSHNRNEIDDSFREYTRTLRLKYYHSSRPKLDSNRHPFKPKSTWEPPQADPTVEKYLEKTKETLDALGTTRHYPNLSLGERQALDRLARDRSIVIKQADKGSLIVVEDSDTYVANGRKHLANKDVYEKLPHDPTPALSEHIKMMLNTLEEKNLIDHYERKFMTPVELPRTQRLYFLKNFIKYHTQKDR